MCTRAQDKAVLAESVPSTSKEKSPDAGILVTDTGLPFCITHR